MIQRPNNRKASGQISVRGKFATRMSVGRQKGQRRPPISMTDVGVIQFGSKSMRATS